jgi:hypothetical protein
MSKMMMLNPSEYSSVRGVASRDARSLGCIYVSTRGSNPGCVDLQVNAQLKSQQLRVNACQGVYKR